MSNLTLSKDQLQACLGDLATQPSGLSDILELTLNALMRAERKEFLAASEKNKGNGFRSIRGLGLGKGITLSLPRDRLGEFKPVILDIMRESQDTMNELFFELYTNGLTTRQISAITESIYGRSLSKSSISNITTHMSEEMRLFRERQIEPSYPVIYIDATFISTRRVDQVSKEAYYVVLGVKPDTRREVLGIYNSPTECASLWSEIILDLKRRGLSNCQLFVTDNLPGVDEAIEKHMPSRVQKCVLHLKRHLLARVKKKHREQMIEDLAVVFDLDDREDILDKALARAASFAKQWGAIYPETVAFSNPNKMQYYFSYLYFHPEIRRMIYTTNWIERLNKSFKRSIKIRNSMPSVDSVLTLLSAIAIDMNDTTYRYGIYRLKKDAMFQ